MGKPVRNLSGKRFGRLSVIRAAGSKHGHMIWRCLCDCGNEKDVYRGELVKGKTKSCGCLHDEGRKPTHGMSGKGKAYNTWKRIKQRCHNPNNPAYKNYGARGIYVCSRWKDSFELFYLDMGEPPTSKHTIERINNDGPYSPDNCSWATRGEQAKNQRPTWRFGSENGRATLSEADVREIRSSNLTCSRLAKEYGVTGTTISQIRRRETWRHVE